MVNRVKKIACAPRSGVVLGRIWQTAMLASGLAVSAGSAWAAQPAAPAATPATVLARSAEGAVLTASDVLADAQRIPPEVRAQLMASPQTMGQLIDNLMVRRVMAQRAQKSIPADAQMQAALQLAQDRVWSDAWLAALDQQHMPSDAQVEKLAREVYRTQPERFQQGDQVRARHILIRGSDASAQAQVQKLLQALRDGGDFAALAKEHSQDPGSAQRGGDLGFFAKGKMVPEFEAAAFGLQDGQRSDLVQSQFGWHIIERTGFQAAGMQPFDTVKAALVTEVKNKALSDARQAALAEIRKQLTLEQSATDALIQSFAAQAPAASAAPAAAAK